MKLKWCAVKENDFIKQKLLNTLGINSSKFVKNKNK